MRILGIDLGSSSIKAVEVDSAFGRYDIHDYHESPITPDITPQSAIIQLLQKLHKTPDRVVLALPTGQTTFRNLQLPTRDKKAIQSGVGFELEDELPFSLEDAVYDYAILSQSKQGSTVHVAASLKKHLASSIIQWQEAELNPDTVTTEAWAYRACLNRVVTPGSSVQNSPVLLIQIGHARTTLYIHWQGAPALTREIPWGGRDLTAGICKKYGIPFEEAETAKLDHGFVSPPATLHGETKDVTVEQSEFSACLEGQLERLILELRQIGLVAKNVTQHNIGLVYLAGGTSLLPGLGPWIEDKLRIPTKPLLSLSSATASGVTYSDQTDARFILAVALTLSLVGPDKALSINFRKGDFSKEGRSSQINLAALKKPLIAAAIVTFCLILSLIVQSSVYNARLKSTDELLSRSVKSFFGTVSSSALRGYMASTTNLRNSINKELNKQRELARLFGPNPKSPIDFLNTLSSAIGRDTVVDMIQYQVGSSPSDPFGATDQPAAASLTFLFSNPQIAEKLATVINGKLSNVQRGKTEEVPAPDGTGKKWKVTFTGAPNEDTYGK
jgi:general secretion pathway protein L